MKKIFIIITAILLFNLPAQAADVETAINNGLSWLNDNQLPNGSWCDDVGVTSLATIAFCNNGYREYDVFLDADGNPHVPVQNAVNWLTNNVQSNGGIYDDYDRSNYHTSLAILALFATENENYYETIRYARNFLLLRQWQPEDQCQYLHVICQDIYEPACAGGFGYGYLPMEGACESSNYNYRCRPDLSNTQFALMALSIVDQKSPFYYINPVNENVWTNAVEFVKRCQNDPVINPDYFHGDYIAGGDGGIIYTPCYSVHTDAVNEWCYSTGSMTAAGIWSYLLSDWPAESNEVSRALNWALEQESDCLFDDQPTAGGSWPSEMSDYTRKYYYYFVLAKALMMCDKDGFDESPLVCNWYDALSSVICEKQCDGPEDYEYCYSANYVEPDDYGSWYSIEYNTESQYEDENRTLATAYAILALQSNHPVTDDNLWMSIVVRPPSGKGSFDREDYCIDLHVFDPDGNHTGRNFYDMSVIDEFDGSEFEGIPPFEQKVILNSNHGHGDVLKKGTYRVEVFNHSDCGCEVSFNIHRYSSSTPIRTEKFLVAPSENQYKASTWDMTLASVFSELDAITVGPFEIPGVYSAVRLGQQISLKWYPVEGATEYKIYHSCESGPPDEEWPEPIVVVPGETGGLEYWGDGGFKYTFTLTEECTEYHLYLSAVYKDEEDQDVETPYSHEIIPQPLTFRFDIGPTEDEDDDTGPGDIGIIPLYVDIPEWWKYLPHPAEMAALKLLLKFPKPLVIIGVPPRPPDPPPGPIPRWFDECGWEYINYRIGAPPDCNEGCPSEFLTFVAIADMNDGPNHPTCFMPEEPGRYELFNVELYVPNDWTLECQYLPIEFYWYDCGDNTFSGATGDTLFIAQRVFNSAGNLIWDENDDVNFPEENRLPNVGAPDFCLNPDPEKPSAIRFIDFFNGGVKIACVDSIDDRGDVNLNGAAYEIADAVVFTNYFIYGLAAFTINQEGQIAATDVNADGMVLSVADLTYLIRVIIGDALPYPKIAPVTAKYDIQDGILSVDQEMGAAYVVIKGNVNPVNLTDNMEMKYAYDSENDVTRALLYSMKKGHIFKGEFLEPAGTLIEIEMATYEGATVKLITDLLPREFILHQNKPNPFNPITDMSFSLPVASDVVLEIYNITGQKVATVIEDRFEAGTHTVRWDGSNYASGIYMYRITAGEFTDSKKMLLLK